MINNYGQIRQRKRPLRPEAKFAGLGGANSCFQPGPERPPASAGVRGWVRRFDFSLCMHCGICVEACPYDAPFWSPEFSYAETDIADLTHEQGRLREWMWTVPPPPRHEEPAAQGGARSGPLNAGAGIQPASARFLRASLSSRKLLLVLAMVLREKGASRPRKLSLWTSRVPPLRGLARSCAHRR